MTAALFRIAIGLSVIAGFAALTSPLWLIVWLWPDAFAIVLSFSLILIAGFLIGSLVTRHERLDR